MLHEDADEAALNTYSWKAADAAVADDAWRHEFAPRLTDTSDMRDDVIASLRKMIVNDLFAETRGGDLTDDGLKRSSNLIDGFVELRTREQQFNVEIDDEERYPENFTIRRSRN